MSTEKDLDLYIKTLREISEENSIKIIETPVENNNSSPFVHINSDDFVEAFKFLRPNVLYLVVLSFKFEHQIGLKFDIDSDDDDESSNSMPLPSVPKTPAFRSLAKKWANKEGHDHSYLGCFMIDGVLHFSSHQDDWAANFDADADKAIEEWLNSEKEKSNLIRSARMEEIKINAKILSEHPQFNAPKSSREKRLYLAEQIFSDIDSNSHREILDLADLMFWYRSNLPK